MNMQLIGKAAGTATLTVTSKTSPDVEALIPVTVAENLIQYGPVSGLASGDSATVNDDGTLNLKGPQKYGNVWNGLKWVCDIGRFTRGGTVTVSAEGLPVNIEVILRFDDKSDSAHTFIYPARGENASTGVVPADAKTVFVAVRRHGKDSDLTSARVAIMVNEGGVALPFARPDVTNASGGAMS